MGEAGPSTLPVGKHGTSTVFVRALGSKKLHCVLVDEGMSMLALWEQHVAPHLWASSSLTELRLVWGGRTLEISADKTVRDHGIPALATLEVLGRLPSQGFSRLHQLMEHLLETLAPAAPAGSPPPADDETPRQIAARMGADEAALISLNQVSVSCAASRGPAGRVGGWVDGRAGGRARRRACGQAGR